MKIKKILVPLDGSKNSFRGLDNAIYIARQCQATITGLHIISLIPKPKVDSQITKMEKMLLDDAAKIMKKARIRSAKNGILFYDKVLYGDPSPKIVEYAKKAGFNLIVIGSRGRGLVKEFFLGSTSNHVLHKSSIPVMITK